MSLDKAIKYRKEKRKKYRKSEAFDCSCRNHGSCSYCHGNRVHKYRKAEYSADEEIEEWGRELLAEDEKDEALQEEEVSLD